MNETLDGRPGPGRGLAIADDLTEAGTNGHHHIGFPHHRREQGVGHPHGVGVTLRNGPPSPRRGAHGRSGRLGQTGQLAGRFGGVDTASCQHKRSCRSGEQRRGALDGARVSRSCVSAVVARSQHRIRALIDLVAQQFGGEFEVDGPRPAPEGVTECLSHVLGHSPRLGDGGGELGDRAEQV
jgi:hypothetical protein